MSLAEDFVLLRIQTSSELRFVILAAVFSDSLWSLSSRPSVDPEPVRKREGIHTDLHKTIHMQTCLPNGYALKKVFECF